SARWIMWAGDLPDAKANVSVLAFAPDNRTLYTGDSEGYVLAWDLAARTHRVLLGRSKRARGSRGVYWLWPTADGRLLTYDEHRVIDALRRDAGPVFDVGSGEWGAFQYLFPDGRRAAKLDPDADWRLDWWDLETNLRLRAPGPFGRLTRLSWPAFLHVRLT